MRCRDPDAQAPPVLEPAEQKEPEEKEKSLSNADHNRTRAAVFARPGADGGTARVFAGPAAPGQGPTGLRRRPALLAAPLMIALALVLAADPALAQAGGGGENINAAITEFANFLSTLIVSLGGVALLVAVIVWLFSGSDERRRQGALRWIGSICVAIFVGLSVPTIVGFIQGIAGGGGA